MANSKSAVVIRKCKIEWPLFCSEALPSIYAAVSNSINKCSWRFPDGVENVCCNVCNAGFIVKRVYVIGKFEIKYSKCLV